MTEEKFNRFLSYVGVGMSIAFIVIGWYFSNLFFSVESGYQVIGLVIIVSITYLQWLYLRDGEEKLDPWIVRAAWASYVYDIASNVGGWLIAFRIPLLQLIADAKWHEIFISMPLILISVMLGVFLAVLPERLFRHTVVDSDFIGMLGSAFSSFLSPVKKGQKKTNQPNGNQPNKTNQNKVNIPGVQKGGSFNNAKEYRDTVQRAQGILAEDEG